MKRTLIRLVAVLCTIFLLLALVACDGNQPGGPGKKAPKNVVKIGLINPTTGPLAGFGEGCPWTENLVVKYVNEELGGIYFEDYDTKLPVELIVYDSTSDTTKCAEMAQKLIEEDKVDLIIARHTPETVNPVSAVAERYGVPCVAIEAPVDAWLGAGPYEWTYHSFWTLEIMYELYSDMWKQAGFGPGTKIGIAFANDADGTAWAQVFRENIVADGFVLVDPGQYPSGTTDFSDVIGQFIEEGVEILAGTNITPDFAGLWLQSNQLGFKPKMVTMGKAYLLESDANAIGADLMDGMVAEVWWSPHHPYSSKLTGMTPAELTRLYLEETGEDITQPMGYKYASLELAVTALMNATNLEPENIRDGIKAIDVETIVGPIKYNDDHWGLTPVAGGQWQRQADGSLKLFIINNSVNPEIPVTGEYKPLP
ncbi:MAG: ABC transporter substrate-binding protein [Saccharofermentanales bacterium]|jgi:branched-chain amino acid transport system substrate-binding protein